MPTYTCTSAEGRLSAEQKSRIASEITRIHAEVTGAPSYFAQMIFSEIASGNWFMGGVPVAARPYLRLRPHPLRPRRGRQDTDDQADGGRDRSGRQCR